MSTAKPAVVVILESDAAPRRFPRVEESADVRYTTAENLSRDLPGADVLLMWDFFSGALQDAWPHADALRWVHIAAAGVDTLLFDDLVASDVTVTNSRGVFDRPIAEFVLGSILAFAKDLPRSLRLQSQSRWQHRETERIEGAHAMVVGTGAIGREIARLLRAVGMRVTGVGRTARDGDDDFGTVHASGDLASVVGDVDHLVLAAPLTEQTRRLVDAAVLRALPPRARLINIARGELVVTDDLVAALRKGMQGDGMQDGGEQDGGEQDGNAQGIAGAALDVFETEPLPADHPLWSIDTAILTAHMSGDAAGWRDRLAEIFVDNFERYIRAADPGALHNIVDKHRGYVHG
ncbi:D-2-hydroxyacid dehydrogenase [Tomitella fengzijianii]|uniref:D-2-hydroxyacid dehydrogenase n=1 Tax=Tomitella fengzijianii TaxID=2597660 RepID=A0A516X6Q7_9ACTN|nr:D-2-hydroxyacid dehydrogenase [Tomitella fengzijianii]QDQ98758.1 D-2-hydroxyacid dehydrogenase [Tomitella fengzijianii]